MAGHLRSKGGPACSLRERAGLIIRVDAIARRCFYDVGPGPSRSLIMPLSIVDIITVTGIYSFPSLGRQDIERARALVHV